MSNLFKENHLLFLLLVSGALFAIVAVGLGGILVLQSFMAEPAATVAAISPPETSPSPTPTRPVIPVSNYTATHTEPISSPTPTPTLTSTATTKPTATSTPASAAGDSLSLPTATPTPSPTSTSTNTPTPTPLPPPVEGLRIGNIAPNFTLGSNRASRVSLSELQGKLVILNFWASWCPPCRYEVPALESVHHEYGPQGVVVLAVNEKEKLENVERFAHDNGISFAVWLDEDGWAGHIYQVRSIPTTYFIDRAGIIRAVQIGSMTREQIVAHLEKLL